ncbi:hypothetical protein D3C71_1784260 [compost metagenome]
MVSDEHTEAAVAQMLDNTLDVDNGDWIDARKRFIQQDKFRICCQGTGYFDAAAFTTGKGLAQAVA